MGVIIWLLIGVVAALVSRFLVPDAAPMGLWDTLVLGVLGSLTGGVVGGIVVVGDVAVTTASVLSSVASAGALLLYARASGDRVATL